MQVEVPQEDKEQTLKQIYFKDTNLYPSTP